MLPIRYARPNKLSFVGTRISPATAIKALSASTPSVLDQFEFHANTTRFTLELIGTLDCQIEAFVLPDEFRPEYIEG